MTWPAGTAYAKTTWNTGDTITAALLTHLETQYDKVANGAIQLTNPLIIGYGVQQSAIAIAAGVLTLDLGAANWFTFTLSSHITSVVLNNKPGNHVGTAFILEILGDASQSAFDWFTSTAVWDFALVPALPANGKYAEFGFTFRDGGTVVRGKTLGLSYAS